MKIDNMEIYFEKEGYGKDIILLHGWGCSHETFFSLKEHLKKDFTVWVLDLPGFGKSEEPKRVYSVIDYMACLRLFIRQNKINAPILLGHSFGGRIAIKYASYYDIPKLILVDSAGLKKRSVKNYLKIFVYKILKKLHIKNGLGSKDYKASTGLMKNVLVNVVREDLKKDLKKIKTDTLIIWGENDLETNLSMGQKMAKLIVNSGIVVIPKAGHFPFIEKEEYFNYVIDSFLSSDKR